MKSGTEVKGCWGSCRKSARAWWALIHVVVLFAAAAFHCCNGAFPGLLSDDDWPSGDDGPKSLRVLIVTAEIVGPVTNGGIGTAMSAMAEALQRAGHRPTLLFTRGPLSYSQQSFEQWVADYGERGIELVGLPVRPDSNIPQHLLTSFAVLRFMEVRDETFDVVHCHDYEGSCYYALLSKGQGRGFGETAFVTGLHGPTMWSKRFGNQEAITDITDLELDFMERKSAELADFVVSPSQYLLDWMRREKWQLNENTFVQPNILPTKDRGRGDSASREQQSVRELVFFGRIEGRKGVTVFCDAIDFLASQAGIELQGGQQNIEKITFLGRTGLVNGTLGVHSVQQRARHWGGFRWEIIDNLGPAEAKEYLRGEGRLAVIPSRIENSPYTVYECAELGIPFIASNVGGISDLIDPRDHEHTLFDPTVSALAVRLLDALRDGVRSGRPKVDAGENERQWMHWHEKATRVARMAHTHGQSVTPTTASKSQKERKSMVSVVLLCRNSQLVWIREAIRSLREQSYPGDRLEVVAVELDGGILRGELVDDFSSRGWQIVEGTHTSVGAARNAGAARSKGEFLLFMSDDDYAHPDDIQIFVAAMQSSKADILTSFIDMFDGDHPPSGELDWPSYMFLGGSSSIGMFKNCFGDSHSFVRRTSFQELGGFPLHEKSGNEDLELYSKATLRGYSLSVIPKSLYHRRYRNAAAPLFDAWRLDRLNWLRPYVDGLSEEEQKLIIDKIVPQSSSDEAGAVAPSSPLASQGDSRLPGYIHRQEREVR